MVPVKVEVGPGADTKSLLTQGQLIGSATLSLATHDNETIELKTSNVNVAPEGDLANFHSQIAGAFGSGLSGLAQQEISKIVNSNVLRRALPKEVKDYKPVIKDAQFHSQPEGALFLLASFTAILSNDQIADLVKKSIGRIKEQ
jgi:chemotaxis protein CheY-P-specific phosphatase CheC